ncbi:acetylglutamate kinase [Lacticaseibacillus daqingensis]|uniref:acetylglutamate kinase n=1 Tax=Lacticaseibacillus daqingensis TaxID=2486014 RepID=UPI000F7709BE|nr:acetylglutamate kinase [Lacticaseibacillus daqingensis]
MKDLIIIKLGGNAATSLPASFFHQLTTWHQQGIALLLIHGGGPQINGWSTRLGLTPRKINGIRVTDAATLTVTQAVLLGLVQPALCQALSAAGLPALGLNTADQQLLVGTPLEPAYGAVGQITSVNQALLRQLLATHIGVLAPLAQTTAGAMLNVNADMAAASIAQFLHPSRLILLTDVPGVMANGTVRPTLTTREVTALIDQHIITNGMQPKVQAALVGAQSGAQVVITDDLTHAGTHIRRAS